MTRPIESFLAAAADDELKTLSRKMAKDPERFAAASRDSEIARQAMSECGINVAEGVEIRLVRQQNHVLHFTIPADPNTELGEEHLADTSGSVPPDGVSTLGSLGTLPSTVLSVSTLAPKKKR
jgi:hypothetical protein